MPTRPIDGGSCVTADFARCQRAPAAAAAGAARPGGGGGGRAGRRRRAGGPRRRPGRGRRACGT